MFPLLAFVPPRADWSVAVAEIDLLDWPLTVVGILYLFAALVMTWGLAMDLRHGIPGHR